MSIQTYDVIDKLPGELQARLEADEFFCDVPVVVAEKGNVKATISQRQALQKEKGGKRGVAVIVLQIVANDDYPEEALGPMTLYPAFQVVELVELNNDDAGTKKSARKVARRIRDVIKTLALPGIVTDINTENPCIVPIDLSDAGASAVGYEIRFKCYECDSDNPLTQVSTPDFAEADGLVSMSCGTPGATIYYTTDDSYPSAQNEAAKVYGNAFPVVAGFIVRACGYYNGMLASYVSRAIFNS